MLCNMNTVRINIIPWTLKNLSYMKRKTEPYEVILCYAIDEIGNFPHSEFILFAQCHSSLSKLCRGRYCACALATTPLPAPSVSDFFTLGWRKWLEWRWQYSVAWKIGRDGGPEGVVPLVINKDSADNYNSEGVASFPGGGGQQPLKQASCTTQQPLKKTAKKSAIEMLRMNRFTSFFKYQPRYQDTFEGHKKRGDVVYFYHSMSRETKKL